MFAPAIILLDRIIHICIISALFSAQKEKILTDVHWRGKSMSNQNVFTLITDDPVKFNTWSLKSKLVMVLVDMIRQQGWNQTKAAEKLNVSQPRMSNLFKGQLDKFSVDTLLEMLLVIGYKLDVSYNPGDAAAPLEMKMKKAML